MQICDGECSCYVGSRCGDRGSEAFYRVDYGPDFWTKIEDNEVVGPIMPSSTERGGVEWTKVVLCGAEVSRRCPCGW